MSRSRFSGDVADLVGTIEPFVKSAGWLQYGDDMQSAKVNSKEILRHKVMISNLAKLHEGFSFKKSTMTAAFVTIAKSHFKRLDLDEADIQQWAKDMDLRIRCMLRHVAQAKAKPSPPAWLGTVLGTASKPADDGSPDDSGTGPGSCEFFYGWDSEHHAAWRQPADGTGAKELTKEIFAKDGSDDMSPMWARWPDGTEHVLSELLKATWDSMQATDAAMHKRGRGSGRDPVPKIWSGTHVSSGAELWVARRTDRQLLTSIYEAGKQIMQVSSNQVVANMEEADRIAVEMAKLYASGTVDRAGLKAVKMDLLQKAGFRAGAAAGSKPAAKASSGPAAAGPRKRPAAAAASGEPPAATPVVKKRPASTAPPTVSRPSPTEDVEAEEACEESDALAFLDDGGPVESVFDLWN